MKRRFVNLLLILTMLAGLCVFLYPTAADVWNRRTQSRAITGFREALEALPQEDLEPMWEDALDYNRQLRQNTFSGDAFTDGDTDGADSLYRSLLNPQGSGIMGYLSIPKIDQKLPLYHGVSQGVLQVAAGHMSGTSLPVGGSGTHCVIAAHRGLPSARLFTDLDRLEPGDLFYLHILDRVLAYRVDRILPMVEKNDYAALNEALQIIPGEDHVTLFTCTPYGINSHRLLVRGIRTEYLGEEDPVGEVPAESMVRFVPAEGACRLLLLAALSLAGELIVGVLRTRRRKRP
ncbi:MAG: class C sortase [Faecousia sp.]